MASAASAHHRLLWMHPFLDGNGRVARLMSYSILRDALDTGGIWSESTRAPLLLNFPATLAGQWMPGLFPEK